MIGSGGKKLEELHQSESILHIGFGRYKLELVTGKVKMVAVNMLVLSTSKIQPHPQNE